MQFGHGKHFIGDGYRSLFLSDNSFNYPFLRIETKLGKLQYTNLYAELQDIQYFENNSIDNIDQMGFAKKYMSTQVLMPALSPTMSEGKLSKWLVKEGDVVRAGDLIAEIETDKATMAMEAFDEGILSEILIEEGAKAEIGATLAVLRDEGEGDPAQETPVMEPEPAVAEPAAPAPPAELSASPPAESEPIVTDPAPAPASSTAARCTARSSRGTRTTASSAPSCVASVVHSRHSQSWPSLVAGFR